MMDGNALIQIASTLCVLYPINGM